MNARLLPLAGFVLVLALLGFGIFWSQRHDPREVPSPLIGKPAPQFSLPVLGDRFEEGRHHGACSASRICSTCSQAGASRAATSIRS